MLFGSVYGDGIMGAEGEGLRLTIATSTPWQLRVSYGGVSLANVGWSLAPTADEGAREHMIMAVVADSQLSVFVDGHAQISNLTMSRWQPESTWRFGVGARTGSQFQKHHVRSLSIVTDALVDDEAVRVQVSRNNQEFQLGTMEYTYQDPPTVSSFSPASGPSMGGTAVLVHGSSFDGGLRYE